MSIINAATFVANAVQGDNEFGTDGTVEATVGRVTKRVPAVKWRGLNGGPGSITAYGLAVRYRTGTKVWHGSADLRDDGRESVSGGLDNRARAKFAYLVGFIDDAADAVRSKR